MILVEVRTVCIVDGWQARDNGADPRISSGVSLTE